MSQRSAALVWDPVSRRIPALPIDGPLTGAVLRCFMQPGPEGLSELETLLSADPDAFMRQCALVLQTANAVLDEEAAAVAELFARDGTPLVCAAGCDGCCHQMVLCHPFEAEVIAAFLQATPEALAAFRADYAHWDAATVHLRRSYLRWAENLYCQGEDDGSHTREDYHVPCPFLDSERRCRIYPVRPYGCRTSVAVDPACARPEAGLPGSRNIHLSRLTTHHASREPLMALLLERLPHTPRLPMPEHVRHTLTGD